MSAIGRRAELSCRLAELRRLAERPSEYLRSPVAARQAEGFALIEIRPQTDMPIGEHRLCLREPLQAQFRLTQPRVQPERPGAASR